MILAIKKRAKLKINACTAHWCLKRMNPANHLLPISIFPLVWEENNFKIKKHLKFYHHDSCKTILYFTQLTSERNASCHVSFRPTDAPNAINIIGQQNHWIEPSGHRASLNAQKKFKLITSSTSSVTQRMKRQCVRTLQFISNTFDWQSETWTHQMQCATFTSGIPLDTKHLKKHLQAREEHGGTRFSDSSSALCSLQPLVLRHEPTITCVTTLKRSLSYSHTSSDTSKSRRKRKPNRKNQKEETHHHRGELLHALSVWSVCVCVSKWDVLIFL